MQMNPAPCCRKNGGIAGLGLWSELATAATGLMFGGTSGTGGTSDAAGAGGYGTSVSPNIAVSPQISPNFIQQMQPQNSGVTAGAAQIGSGGATSLPASTGQGTGYGSAGSYPMTPQQALPMSVDAAIPTVQPSQQWTQLLTQALPWLIGGAVLLVGIKAWKAR
jgi:hypothetical protein